MQEDDYRQIDRQREREMYEHSCSDNFSHNYNHRRNNDRDTHRCALYRRLEGGNHVLMRSWSKSPLYTTPVAKVKVPLPHLRPSFHSPVYSFPQKEKVPYGREGQILHHSHMHVRRRTYTTQCMSECSVHRDTCPWGRPSFHQPS